VSPQATAVKTERASAPVSPVAASPAVVLLLVVAVAAVEAARARV
jgi:hypothetical protein